MGQPKQMAALLAAINAKGLEQLDISSWKYDVLWARSPALRGFLQQLRSLQALQLGLEAPIEYDDLVSIIQTNAGTLKRLSLGEARILRPAEEASGSSGTPLIPGKFLEALSRCRELVQLDLSATARATPGDSRFWVVTDHWHSMLDCCSSVTNVDLSNIIITAQCDRPGSGARTTTWISRLQHFDLSGCPAEWGPLLLLGQPGQLLAPNLVRLQLDYSWPLLEYFQGLTMPSLTTLRVSRWYGPQEFGPPRGPSFEGCSMPQLTSLDISMPVQHHADLSEFVTGAVNATGSPSKLRELRLVGCTPLEDRTLVPLVRKCPALVVLDVSGCSMVTDALLLSLAVMKPPCLLKELTITGAVITTPGLQVLLMQQKALRNSLRALRCSRQRLGDQFAHAPMMGEALDTSRFRSLLCLNMARSGPVTRAWAQSLLHCAPGLRQLYLPDCYVPDALEVLRELALLRLLTTLSLSGWTSAPPGDRRGADVLVAGSACSKERVVHALGCVEIQEQRRVSSTHWPSASKLPLSPHRPFPALENLDISGWRQAQPVLDLLCAGTLRDMPPGVAYAPPLLRLKTLYMRNCSGFDADMLVTMIKERAPRLRDLYISNCNTITEAHTRKLAVKYDVVCH